MITTPTLAARLAAGYCREKVLANMDASDQAMILDAINEGVREWFEFAPPTLKRTAAADLLRAPVDMTAQIVQNAKGFTYIAPDGVFPTGGYQSEDDLLGHTCLVSGDSTPNRLQASSTLLIPYIGQTGNVTITFLGDAIAFRRTQVIVGQRVRLGINSEESALEYADPVKWDWVTHNRLAATGQPRYFTTEEQAPMDGTQYSWVLRVWPLPQTTYTLRYDLELTQEAYDLDALKIAEPIPIPDEEFSSLIKLCAAHLVGLSIWSPSASPDMALTKALNVSERLKYRSRPARSQSQNWHGTPPGY